MEASASLSEKAAIGLVIERTGWHHDRAAAWLALQAERGTVGKQSGLLIARRAGGVAATPVPPSYSLADFKEALAALAPPNSSAERRPRPAGLERWYVAEHLQQGYATREQDLAAARARFGPWTKDWQDLRELRRDYAPPEWREPGRKSGVE